MLSFPLFCFVSFFFPLISIFWGTVNTNRVGTEKPLPYATDMEMKASNGWNQDDPRK